MLVVGWPGHLITSVLGARYDELAARAGPWRERSRRAGAHVPVALKVSGGVLAAGLIAGFVEPGFGHGPGSARLLVSICVSFAVESVLGWWLIWRVLRRTDPELVPTVRFRYGSLLIVAGSVLLTRVTGFEPGMVFGTLVGLSFGVELARAKDARVTLLGAGYGLVLALGGWVGYSLLVAALPTEPGVLGVFLVETCSGIAVSGIASLPIALLPLAALDGRSVYAWSRLAWAGAYSVGMMAFLLVLMPMPFAWGTVSAPFATWLASYLAYAAAAVALWLWFRPREHATTPASGGAVAG